MATYYVRMSGNDANDGLSPDTAFRTITKACSVANAGDTVYIGAGNYNEYNISFANTGSDAATIKIIGDYAGTYTGDPGMIIIGNLYDGGAPSSNTYAVFNVGGKSDIEFYNLVFLMNHIFDFYGGATNIHVRHCYAICGSFFKASSGYVLTTTIEQCVIWEYLWNVFVYPAANSNITIKDCAVIASFALVQPYSSTVYIDIYNSYIVVNVLVRGNKLASINLYDSILICNKINNASSVACHNCLTSIYDTTGFSGTYYQGVSVLLPLKDFTTNGVLTACDDSGKDMSLDQYYPEPVDFYNRSPINIRDLGAIEVDYPPPGND